MYSGRIPVGLAKFTCMRCVYCCYFSTEDSTPILFPWEKRLIEEIAEKHGVDVSFKPIEVYIDSNGDCAVTLYRWIIRGFCPFYRIAGSRCTIHEVKPLACRMYPLIVDMSGSRVLVSSKCKWVEERISMLNEMSRQLTSIFNDELRAASEAYTLYHDMITIIRELGLKKLSDTSLCSNLHDADRYVLER